MRLVEGDDRVSDARPERRAQARVGRLLHGRQPWHPRLARIRAPGRRHRADDAGPGRGRRLEGSGRRVQRRQQRDHAPALRPHDHLRQGGGSRRQAHAAGERAAQGPEGLEAHRQAGEAPRHDGQADRRAGLRVGPEAARDAQCRHQGLSGVRRQGEELRSRQGQGHAGCPARGAGRRFRASPWWPTHGGRPRPRSTRCPSSGTRARMPRCRAPRSPRC